MVRDVVVDGKTIVDNGRCTGVDLNGIEQELRGIYRANAKQLAPFQHAWPKLSARVQDWFEAHMQCS